MVEREGERAEEEVGEMCPLQPGLSTLRQRGFIKELVANSHLSYLVPGAKEREVQTARARDNGVTCTLVPRRA
jgi:hypothetical protein